MNALKLLSEQIKPELNLLYTVPPFKKDGHHDCGWYCREHAFHCFVLCNMLHLPCSIVQGDFAVLADGLPGVTSLDAHSDHAWCQVQEVCPVDLSMTFHLFGGGHVLVGPLLDNAVLGTGTNGNFAITYSTDEKQFRKVHEKPEFPNWVGFLERQRLAFPINALLDDPFLFLHRPKKEGWADIHGLSIFSKISMHIYKVFQGDLEPLHPKHSPASALQVIKARYGAATIKIKRIIDS